MGRTKSVAESGDGTGTNSDGAEKKRQAGAMGTRISGMWAVPIVYGIIAGLEGVLAGSVVGLL